MIYDRNMTRYKAKITLEGLVAEAKKVDLDEIIKALETKWHLMMQWRK